MEEHNKHKQNFEKMGAFFSNYYHIHHKTIISYENMIEDKNNQNIIIKNYIHI